MGIPEESQNLPLQSLLPEWAIFASCWSWAVTLAAQLWAGTQNPLISWSVQAREERSYKYLPKGRIKTCWEHDFPCQKTSRLVASTPWRIYFTHKQRLGDRFTAPMIFMGFLLWQGSLEPSTVLCFPDLCSRFTATLTPVDMNTRCSSTSSFGKQECDFLYCNHPWTNPIYFQAQHGLTLFG